MYEPGGKSAEEELYALAAALRRGESDPLYRVIFPRVVSVGSSGLGILSGNTYCNLFADAASQAMHFAVCLDLGWVEASDLVPQICWAPSTAAAGNVDWQLDYTIIQPNGTPTNGVLTGTSAAPGVVDQSTILELAPISMTGRPIRTSVFAQLVRLGAADTYNATVQLIHFAFLTKFNGVGAVYPEAKA